MPPQFMPNEYFASWFFQGTANQVEKVVGSSLWMKNETSISGSRVRSSMKNAWTMASKYMFFGRKKRRHLFQSMPPIRDLVTRVSVSTVQDWSDYVAWEKALCPAVFTGQARLESLAQELTDGAQTKAEAFSRLYHYATQEIRYQQDYENTIAGVKPHACSVVLERGYGDCKDKAVLLILLAKQVGHPSSLCHPKDHQRR